MVLHPFITGTKEPEDCLVLIVDLQDSTKFYNAPDAEDSVRIYLNHVMKDLDQMIRGGFPDRSRAQSKSTKGAMPHPDHVKFLGDGFLFIWKTAKLKNRKKNLMTFIAHLISYQQKFEDTNNHFLKGDVNKAKLPTAIRYGMAGGHLRMFTVKGHPEIQEWLGPAINMASRLESYCKELGFLLHDIRILKRKDLEELGFAKLYARSIRGADGEVLVYVDHQAFSTLGKRSAMLFRGL